MTAATHSHPHAHGGKQFQLSALKTFAASCWRSSLQHHCSITQSTALVRTEHTHTLSTVEVLNSMKISAFFPLKAHNNPRTTQLNDENNFQFELINGRHSHSTDPLGARSDRELWPVQNVVAVNYRTGCCLRRAAVNVCEVSTDERVFWAPV